MTRHEVKVFNINSHAMHTHPCARMYDTVDAALAAAKQAVDETSLNNLNVATVIVTLSLR